MNFFRIIEKHYYCNEKVGKMVEEITKITMGTDGNGTDEQPSIMVPIDDLDVIKSDSPHTVDELAQELATIKQSAKKIAIIGSRNLPITHQQMIETLHLQHPYFLSILIFPSTTALNSNSRLTAVSSRPFRSATTAAPCNEGSA